MPVIPDLGRLRQEDHEFETKLDYTARLCLKGNKNNRREGMVFLYSYMLLILGIFPQKSGTPIPEYKIVKLKEGRRNA